jgi:hypothetical protein
VYVLLEIEKLLLLTVVLPDIVPVQTVTKT